MRRHAAKKYNLKDFQFSLAYPFFYDQLNKANIFLENMLDLAEEPLDSRLMTSLLAIPTFGRNESQARTIQIADFEYFYRQWSVVICRQHCPAVWAGTRSHFPRKLQFLELRSNTKAVEYKGMGVFVLLSLAPINGLLAASRALSRIAQGIPAGQS